jgi:hypothetical protein
MEASGTVPLIVKDHISIPLEHTAFGSAVANIVWPATSISVNHATLFVKSISFF